MKTTISKEFRFEAAHVIPHHRGKCARPHGHSYRVVVVAEGPIKATGAEAGMVTDFAVLKTYWKEALEPRLDHRDLNESLLGEVRWTTAEEIAAFLLREFTLGLPDVNVVAVTVWETSTSSATATA